MQLKLSTLGRYYRSYPRNVDANWTGLFVIVLLVTIIIIIRVIYASSVSRMSKIIAFVQDSKNRSHRRRWVLYIINIYICTYLYFILFFSCRPLMIFFSYGIQQKWTSLDVIPYVIITFVWKRKKVLFDYFSEH